MSVSVITWEGELQTPTKDRSAINLYAGGELIRHYLRNCLFLIMPGPQKHSSTLNGNISVVSTSQVIMTKASEHIQNVLQAEKERCQVPGQNSKTWPEICDRFMI